MNGPQIAEIRRVVLSTFGQNEFDLFLSDQFDVKREDVARKLALCFRQIGAAVVRVSGRAVSSYPPRDR